MGVHGLWKLIDSAGKPIPIETLENKVLGVDVSIWLYQLVKGFQERAGRSVNNPFLLGLFRRICKLLFYRIKPVFVFDGGVPVLKKKTIAARHRNRSRANEISESLKKTLLENLAKQHALGKVLGEGNIEIPKMLLPKQDTMFHLPPLSLEGKNSDDDSDSSEEYTRYKYSKDDLQSLDITSEEFLALPADIRHDILSELKETRKQNSWANVHLMPENSTDFSSFQMGRLLKRRAVQVGLEKAEGEMGTRGFTISDIQDILKQQGIDVGQRIAADNVTSFLYASANGDKALNKINVPVIPTKKMRKSVKSNKEKQFIEYEDESSSSIEEYCVDDPDDQFPTEEDLSQQEILNLIKEDSASNTCFTKIYDLNLPSTSKVHLEHDIKKQNFNLDNIEKNEGMKKTVIQDHVNDQVMEHGNKLSKDNEQLKLDHESLPRVEVYNKTTSSQKDSNNHSLEREQKVDSKLSVSKTTIKEVKIIENKNVSSFSDNKKKLSIQETNCLNNLEKNVDQSDNIDYNQKVISDLITKKVFEEKIVAEVEEPVTSPKILQDSSESDDDFLEVSMNKNNNDNDLSLSKSEHTIKSTTATLEIVINPDERGEEDIFADLFNSNNKDLSKITTIDQEPDSVNPSDKETRQIIDKSNIVKVVTSPDPAAKAVTKNYSPEKFEIERVVESFEGQSIKVEYKSEIKPAEGRPHLESTKAECSTPLESNKEVHNAITAEHYFNQEQLNIEEIINMKTNLEKESAVLVEETSREERIAATISEQTTVEAQELLRLFGLPFIVAPMEAEAQCAFLDITGQTQGTITDDSDIWLFGASNVYKNFFDQKKFVKQFKATDIERVYHMDREDLIMLAMLSGSDYTSGLPGIGPVNALEITARFRPRDEHASPDQRLTRFVQAYKAQKLDEKLAKKLKNLQFLEGFPSSEVVRAYMLPAIDDSKEPFSWASPNLERLRQYTQDKFGWNRSEADRVLLPIMDKLKQNKTQRTMHNYFEWAFDNLESKMSRRVEKAVSILGGKFSPQKLLPTHQKVQKSSTSTNKVIMKPVNSNTNLPLKSKTPAQIAREKAAKKLKEIRKLEKEKKQKKTKES